MHKSFQILLLLAAAPILTPLPAVAEMRPATATSASGAAIPRPDRAVFIGDTGGGMSGGGMTGGMTGGGMSGMTGGGMSGMTPGGMGGVTPGGMGGVTPGGMNGGMPDVGVGDTSGGLPGYSIAPVGGVSQSYGGDATTSGSYQPAQNYQCVTQQGHCSVSSTAGSLRHGASCTCLFGGLGKIK